jgi:8-oxo-dGTP pyrophosphatase MutT (NUDIX family)
VALPVHLEHERAALRQALAGPLPGRVAQMRMTPRPRPDLSDMPPGHRPRPGSVLVLLYPWEDAWYLPLTRRTDIVVFHRGQISLPGGAREDDETPLQTAVRETEEELGVPREHLDVLGALTPLFIPPSDFCITPFVAAWAGAGGRLTEERPTWRPDPIEVAEVLEVPLALLRDPATIHQGSWVVRGIEVVAPYFAVGEHRVWGATAMVLSELLALFNT